jgi:hypothetical protein
VQDERRALGEGLDDGDVGPDRLGAGGDDDLQPGAETGACPGDPAGRLAGVTRRVDAHSAAEEFDFQFDRFQHAISQIPRATPGYDGNHTAM